MIPGSFPRWLLGAVTVQGQERAAAECQAPCGSQPSSQGRGLSAEHKWRLAFQFV